MTDRQTSSDVLVAPMVIEYPFSRTTGPVIGAFLTGLRERMLVGIKAGDLITEVETEMDAIVSGR